MQTDRNRGGRPAAPEMLTADQRRHLAAASKAVNAAQEKLDEATAARHAMWVALVDAGATQSEVARASGVIRQAVGWAVTHRQAS